MNVGDIANIRLIGLLHRKLSIQEIRKVIYTTNAIESLNSVIRKATERRKLFPTDQSAMKVVYLAIEQAAKKWSMPIRDWKPALNQFMILYEDRFPEIF